MSTTLSARIQAFECIYYFIDPSDWYSLSIVSKLFDYLFNKKFVHTLKNDICFGKESKIENGLGFIKVIAGDNNYPQIPKLNFEYITENIHWRFATNFLSCCNCADGECNDALDCECCNKYGYHYDYDNHTLNKSLSEITRIIECNEYCKCSLDKCKNRLTQIINNKRKNSLYLKYNINTKWCLFTNREINKGEFICEYIGEILNKSEIKEREIKNYMITLNEINNRDNDKKIISSISIDGYKYGNISRFINHSCSPNLKPQLIYSKTDIPRICFFSIEDIKANTELTWNYGSIHSMNNDNIASTQPCFCGSSNCQQYLPHSVL